MAFGPRAHPSRRARTGPGAARADRPGAGRLRTVRAALGRRLGPGRGRGARHAQFLLPGQVRPAGHGLRRSARSRDRRAGPLLPAAFRNRRGAVRLHRLVGGQAGPAFGRRVHGGGELPRLGRPAPRRRQGAPNVYGKGGIGTWLVDCRIRFYWSKRWPRESGCTSSTTSFTQRSSTPTSSTRGSSCCCSSFWACSPPASWS